MKLSTFQTYLKSLFPNDKIINGAVDSNSSQCIGLFIRETAPSVVAIGLESSYNILPITIVVHWTENSDTCETKALAIYNAIKNKQIIIGDVIVKNIHMKNSHPTSFDRDERNICEMLIHCDIYYNI